MHKKSILVTVTKIYQLSQIVRVKILKNQINKVKIIKNQFIYFYFKYLNKNFKLKEKKQGFVRLDIDQKMKDLEEK